MKKLVFYLIVPIAVLLISSCKKTPEFIEDESWDVWIALKSDVDGIDDLRQNVLETLINRRIASIENDDLAENEKVEQLISVTCCYAAFKFCNPIDSDGEAINYDDSGYQFNASWVSTWRYNDIMETFNLDIRQDVYIYYVNVNEDSLKEQARMIYNDYCHEFAASLRESVHVYEWERDKERSDRRKGISIYDVIYSVSIGNGSRYVRCQCMENDALGRSEIEIENKSEYLLDL